MEIIVCACKNVKLIFLACWHRTLNFGLKMNELQNPELPMFNNFLWLCSENANYVLSLLTFCQSAMFLLHICWEYVKPAYAVYISCCNIVLVLGFTIRNFLSALFPVYIFQVAPKRWRLLDINYGQDAVLMLSSINLPDGILVTM